MRYESGETEPTLDDLKKIAAVLKIETDMIFNDDYRFWDYPYTAKTKELRKGRGMLQREFGELLDVAAGTVKRWESGRHTVTWEMWEKLNRL